ncbi:hypothetical protein C8Q79DRAFT_899775 [Trametes meyenii]|nr:hypothetical protein C8Q79DRAFT_899775 [Trametes meyenii]
MECTLSLPHALTASPRPQHARQDVSPAIQAFVHAAILRSLHDPVGLRDHALRAYGGRIVPSITSPSFNGISPSSQGTYLHPPAEVVLNDDLHIGTCLHFPNGTGQIGVLLPHLLYPSSFSVDHIPWEVSAAVGEAPRTLLVWGVVDGHSNDLAMEQLHQAHQISIPILPGRSGPPLFGQFNSYVLLSSFQYNLYGPHPVQTFTVDPAILASRMYFGIFVFEIIDNWGAPSTCLYHVRIHGEEKLSPTA